MKPRWQQRPPGSNWGEFGPDDQRGRMNLVTHEKVLQGVAEVKEGITFCLSLPLDYPGGSVLNPRRSPPRLAATLRGGKQNFCFPLAAENPDFTDVISDDLVLLTLQYSTQWDSFAHIGSRFDADGDGEREIVFYNGFRAGADVRPAPENRAAEPWEKDAVEIEKGDMVCLYTGFADVILELKKNPDPKLLHGTCSGLDGRDERLLQWISDSGLACLIADNYAVEIIPTSLTRPKPHASMPLHEHCIFKNGIHLGELWYLTGLARWLREHGRNRFLLTAPPLRLPGAVGSPATPIATV
jgi:hypothetical protein